jgi:serine/threonine protein kinase
VSELRILIQGSPQSLPHEIDQRQRQGIPADTTPTPMRIGRYEVLGHLAPGAFGFVLRAYDPVFMRPCALKVPNPNVLAEPGKRRRFLQEARALERLGDPAPHPNVVRVYDADECGGICYIAMELCELGSLADWLADLPEGAVTPKYWAAELVKQIAAGVQHAHERGIYHRDLKPANLLLTPFDATPTTEALGYEVSRDFPRFCPKVADLGLAKILGDNDLTVDGAMIGTKPYMAPEQIRCDSASVGKATDVWALGVILYELLTRRLPFAGPSEEAFRNQICEEAPTRPQAIRELPRGLETVCLKCLEKDPCDRYRSPSELANELQRVLEHLDPLGRPAPYWKRIARGVKRRPVRVAFSGMAIFGLLGAAGVAEIKRQSDRQVQEIKRQSDRQVLLANFVALGPTDLQTWVPRLNPRDRIIADFLAQLYRTGTPDQRLSAALVMARERPDLYAEYCFEQLLDAEPRRVRVVAELLKSRMPGLASRLEAGVDRASPAPDSPPEVVERYHRHRANAACALILLGQGERGWTVLRFTPYPQSRSFLIQMMGPAGVDPHRIFARLSDPATETSIRRALIQSLDGIVEGAWGAGFRQRVTSHLLSLYRDDPDPGVHGSAKWLLRRRGAGADLDRIDGELAGKSLPENFRWRIGPEGLTWITIDDPRLDRVIEVSDTEITVAFYRRFRPDAVYEHEVSPEDSCPINAVSCENALAFCSWLGSGFRPPTDLEFDVLCSAGTRTRRYHGDSDALFDRYAWIMPTSGGRAHPVAGLIPNDLGLFDTLGNVQEWCQPNAELGPPWASDLRGGWCSYHPSSELDRYTVIDNLGMRHRDPTQGFRVVRTKSVRAR